jgi:hypothetical protein
MPDLQEAFGELRKRLESLDAPDLLHDAVRRAPTVRSQEAAARWKRVGVVAAALLIAIASTMFAVRAFDQPESVASGPTPLPAVEPREIVTIPVGPTGQVSAITSGFGSVWVAAYGVSGGEGIDRDAILRLDPATDQITDTVPVQTVPTWETGGGGLVAGFGSVWVAGWARVDGHDQGLLLRIDPETLSVAAEIRLPAFDGATDVATNDTAVWVVGRTGDTSGISKIDPATDQVVGQTPLRGQAARHVVATDDAVLVEELEWTGNQGPCPILASIDPIDAHLLAEQPQGSCSGGGPLFVWGGDVWLAGADGFARVDPATATAVPPETPYEGEHGFRGDVAVGASGAWFGAYPGGNGGAPDTLSRFDPAAGRIDTYSLKVGWSAATVLDDTIWAMNFEGTVTRFNLEAPSSQASGAVLRIGDGGEAFSVEVPAGWTIAKENLTPWLSRPTEVLSVGTFHMPVSRDPGDELRVADAPVAPATLAAMTSTDAFVSLQASGQTDAPDDRPSSFRTARDRRCCSERTGDYPFTWWWIPFIDQGHAFYLFVAIGNDAEASTSDQAWAIADSLAFGENAVAPP